MTDKLIHFVEKDHATYSTYEKIILLHEHWTRVMPYSNSRESEQAKEIDNYFREAIIWPDNEEGGIYQSHAKFKSLVLKLPKEEQVKLLSEFESHLFNYSKRKCELSESDSEDHGFGVDLFGDDSY